MIIKMKKYYLIKEKSNHIILKSINKMFLYFLFLILIILYFTINYCVLTSIIKTKNNKVINEDKDSIISYKNNILNTTKNMKHAILLLSSYGIEYLNNFLVQFNNDKRYDIYIHLDGKTKSDIDKKKTIIDSNIKYCQHKYKAERFSIEMVDAMYELLSIAYKSDNYDYYHFFSESCYLVKSLDKFYDFFVENNLNSYVSHYKNQDFLYKNKSHILYKGSQWMSLHKNIVRKLLVHKDLYNKYKEEIKNGTIIITHGAIDEFIIQNMIIHDICNETPKKYNIINDDLRFVRWSCNNDYCPNYLNIDNISEYEINKIKEKYLIIRKINFKDAKAI